MTDEILIGGIDKTTSLSRMRKWGATPGEGLYVTNKRIIGTKKFSYIGPMIFSLLVEGPLKQNEIDNLPLDKKIEIINKLEESSIFNILKEDITKIEIYQSPQGFLNNILVGNSGTMNIFCKSEKKVTYLHTGDRAFDTLTDLMQRFYPEVIIHYWGSTKAK